MNRTLFSRKKGENTAVACALDLPSNFLLRVHPFERFFPSLPVAHHAHGASPLTQRFYMPQNSLITTGLKLARWPALAIATAWLAGCAYAPGLSMGQNLAADAQRLPRITTQRGSTDTQTDRSAQDAPPPGALLSITADLLRQQRAALPSDVGQDVKSLFGEATPYIIGPGDVLNIVVWDHPELAIIAAGSSSTADASSLTSVGNGYNVSPDGLIQFPYVGQIQLGGITEYQARDLLTKRLAKYIKDPQVTVRIQAYRSGRVYIDGEVRTPGLQPINDLPMTLPEALNRAGGMTASADRSRVAISRNGSTTAINLLQLSTLGINPNQILLRRGDLLHVHNRDESKVFVMGEVTRPLAQPLRNGRLTLNEALGEAGGLNATSGDPRQIYVVRSQAQEHAKIYHLDASSPMAFALAEGFELQSHDVVYVDPVPLVRWNRVISLILPSAQAVNVTRDAVN